MRNIKRDTKILIEGVSMTELRQQEVGQQIIIALAKAGVETDDAAIKFETEF